MTNANAFKDAVSDSYLFINEVRTQDKNYVCFGSLSLLGTNAIWIDKVVIDDIIKLLTDIKNAK